MVINILIWISSITDKMEDSMTFGIDNKLAYNFQHNYVTSNMLYSIVFYIHVCTCSEKVLHPLHLTMKPTLELVFSNKWSQTNLINIGIRLFQIRFIGTWHHICCGKTWFQINLEEVTSTILVAHFDIICQWCKLMYYPGHLDHIYTMWCYMQIIKALDSNFRDDF